MGLDIIGSAARLANAGLSELPRKTPALRQRVVSIDGRPVKSGSGRSIAVDGAFTLRGLTSADTVVIPGVFATTPRAVERLLARDEIRRATQVLTRAAGKGVVLAASCSATFVLAASGLLEQRPATTTWWLVPEFARRFPSIALDADRLVIDAGKVLTAGSAFAHADLMLAVLARTAGAALAKLVSRYLALDARSSQAPFVMLDHVRVADSAVEAAEKFVANNVERQISIDEMARTVAVSPRTLSRRIHAALGMTPHELVQRVRVRHAEKLLLTTEASVDEIASRVGYADAAAFRRVFKEFAGESPRARRVRSAARA